MTSDTKLKDVLLYICRFYPHPNELSKARITKMVYLADWLSAQRHGRQMTGIQWTFNHYGPYVDDVVELARRDSAFEVLEDSNMYGSPKQLIQAASEAPTVLLTTEEEAVLQEVIGATSIMYWSPFIAYVYDTYPVRTQPRYTPLDLVKLANEEQRLEAEA